AHGLVHPLITTATGAKFGKSEAGAAIYLDPALTSPYKFYQFWVNADDRDVESYLKLFTLKEREEIRDLVAKNRNDPSAREAQRALAEDVTRRVHGPVSTEGVISASKILFDE